MSNELQVMDTTLPAPLRNPKEILEEAGERAKALKDMVKQTGCSKRIGNKEHLQIEAWATIGNFYGCTAAADEATPFELDGIKGAKAHARVIHKESGRVISEAISYCLRDEDNWAHKPFFQLSSMAQTRACSKALANAFRWVVVMAGYATTPAEEMTGQEYAPVIPQVRKPNDATMVKPADRDNPFDDPYPLPNMQADNGQHRAADVPAPPVKPATLDAPATSGADMARKIADTMDEQYEEGLIGNLQPYQGTKAYQTKIRPGYFDLEDGQGGVVKTFKYFDNGLDLTSGLKRVYYRTENYKGQISYAATKIEALE